MENRNYDLRFIRRLLEFPLKVDGVAVRPRNDYVLKNARLSSFFITFTFGYEHESFARVNGLIHKSQVPPCMGISRPGDTIDMFLPTVRHEIFFRYDSGWDAEKLFGLRGCCFTRTPGFDSLLQELYVSLEQLRRPGMADRIDLLAIGMAREAMLNPRDSARKTEQGTSPDDRIFQVADYINLHYDEPLNLESLIRKTGMEPRSFYREWNKAFTESPKKLLMELRFRKACELLLNTRCTIAEISGECGFYSPMYFCRVFRSAYGTTPLEYRNAAVK